MKCDVLLGFQRIKDSLVENIFVQCFKSFSMQKFSFTRQLDEVTQHHQLLPASPFRPASCSHRGMGCRGDVRLWWGAWHDTQHSDTMTTWQQCCWFSNLTELYEELEGGGKNLLLKGGNTGCCCRIKGLCWIQAVLWHPLRNSRWFKWGKYYPKVF